MVSKANTDKKSLRDKDDGKGVRLRLYCHGVGDCLLVGLPRKDGAPDQEPKRLWIVIDCGLLPFGVDALGPSAKDKMKAVAANIRMRTGGMIYAVVATHEHIDHIGGFVQAADEWNKMRPKEVWMSWAENPNEPLARELDRYKSEVMRLVAGARDVLAMEGDAEARAWAGEIDSLAGFWAKGERSRGAREAVKALAPGNVRDTLRPGDVIELDEVVAGIRIYVLGPPESRTKLGIHDMPENEYRFGLSSFSALAPMAGAFATRAGIMRRSQDPGSPFDDGVGCSFQQIRDGNWECADAPGLQHLLWKHYFNAAPADCIDPADCDEAAHGPPDARRRIDSTWLGPASEFALQLDRNTNNTSLVLAFELGDGGPVLLFAADAQAGNWSSWRDVWFPPIEGVRGRLAATDLLKRTVFYKVGHHGSVNATAKDLFESMAAEGLLAFVPVDARQVAKTRWKDVPSAKVIKRIDEKAQGRVIRSDNDWIRDRRKSMPAALTEDGALVRLVGRGGDDRCSWVELEVAFGEPPLPRRERRARK